MKKERLVDVLNECDDAKARGLELLADDGQGHQCWAFRRGAVCYRLARDEDVASGEYEWTDNVNGWD
jgi:hypothetical protein